MKLTLILSMLFTSTLSFSQQIQYGDILKKNSLIMNVDGIELWDIPVEEREMAINTFTEKCLVEIPNRTFDQANDLEVSHPFFNYRALDTDYKVVYTTYRGFGTQLTCRATITTNKLAQFHFTFEYSQIFSDRNGTEQICRDQITDIDATSVVDGVLIRRAYFAYSQDRNGNVFFPKCQTLKVFVTPNK